MQSNKMTSRLLKPKKFTVQRKPLSKNQIEFLAKLVQNSPAWYFQRQFGLGASTLAGLIGLSKYTTPKWSVIQKLEAVDQKPDLWDPEPMKLMTDPGHKYEPVVAAWVNSKYGGELETRGIIVNNKFPWLRISPDRVNSLTEIKYRNFMPLDKVPDDYMCQTQAQMQGLDQTSNLLASLCIRGGINFRGFRIPRDDEYWYTFVMPRMEDVFVALESGDMDFNPIWYQKQTDENIYKCKYHLELEEEVPIDEFKRLCASVGVDPTPELHLISG
jgi:hypothetical protein